MGRRSNGARQDTRSSVVYVLALFLGTRALLTVVGAVSRAVFGPALAPLRAPHTLWWVYSSHRPFLDIWGVADTEWYVEIAKGGYTTATIMQGQANYNFFPLYPLLMRVLGRLVGDPFLAGVIISNAALALACVVLYLLVRLDDDDGLAVRSAKYLLLFPTSFVFSGVLSEGLYLLLLVSSVYAARRGQWLAAGILGGLLSLTRSAGVLVLFPLAYEYYLAVRGGARARTRDALALLLIPCGVLLFAAYLYHLTGDPLAYVHSQTRWNNAFRSAGPPAAGVDPAIVARLAVVAMFVLGAFVYLVMSRRALRVSYWLVGIYTVLLPVVVGGPSQLLGTPRYIAEAFPLYILLARTSMRTSRKDETLAPLLAAGQGFLMAIWSNGGYLPL